MLRCLGPALLDDMQPIDELQLLHTDHLTVIEECTDINNFIIPTDSTSQFYLLFIQHNSTSLSHETNMQGESN